MDDLSLLAIISTVVFLLLAVFIVSFALVFQRRQLENLREKTALRAAFEEEIMKAQIEVQNQTLQRIGNELHDNIGQLLSVSKLYLNQLEESDDPIEMHELGTMTNGVIDQTIAGVRSLTKSLDGDFVRDFGFVETLTHEVHRLNITGRFTATFVVTGERQSLGFEREIVLFRVVQEAINNMLKHAQARRLEVSLHFDDVQVRLQLTDDGRGFDYAAVANRPMSESGAGLRNIHRRIELIGGSCTYQTALGQGTTITLLLPCK